MRNKSYKANSNKNSKITSLNLNSKQFVSVKRSNGILVRTLKEKHTTTAPAVGLKCKKSKPVARINLKKPTTITLAVGPKGKGLIKIKVQNVVDGLIRLEIVISVRTNEKESSTGNILIKGSIKDKKKGGAKNKLLIRGQGTKIRKDLGIRSSNNTEPNLLTNRKSRALRRGTRGRTRTRKPRKNRILELKSSALEPRKLTRRPTTGLKLKTLTPVQWKATSL
jgi:hypothetical protein